MPTLNWIGKEAVVRHHKDVPLRLLEAVPTLSQGEDGGNLLVQGDNLDALKALLPQYAGKVKCIYIDPPYNTGNEGWVYNDNVNSPEIRQWLGQVVGGEVLDRHDRWLCMMYPRLALLRQFLKDGGIIAVSIDDNELENLLLLMDEIFSRKNRVVIAPVLAEPSGGKSKEAVRIGHEYLVIYSKGQKPELQYEIRVLDDHTLSDDLGRFSEGDKLIKWGSASLRNDRPKMWFPLTAPDGSIVYPIRNDGKEGRWRWGKANPKMRAIMENPENALWKKRPYDDGVVVDGQTERWVPYEKIRDVIKEFGWNSWIDKFGYNSTATKEIKEIFGGKSFDTPKPVALIKWLINLLPEEDSIILDSFAGSGTTGHAVLKQNAEDGGRRRFILVEMDKSIAENITAERLRRVSEGYPNARGQNVPGLGGGFQFCRLSKEPLFTAEGQIRRDVSFAQLAAFVWFMETQTGYAGQADSPLLGVHEGRAIYLLYNGILGDMSASGGNALTREIYDQLPVHAGPKTIYASAAQGSEWLEREQITFKQTPYEVKS